jgi:hypothetical protein
MALKRYWHGSVGPLLYDDVNFSAFRGEGQAVLETVPSSANELVRADDLSVVPGGPLTVADEKLYGLDSAVGTSARYAREDHTHGTPENPIVTQAAITDPIGGGTIDSEARAAVLDILAALRANGIIAT